MRFWNKSKKTREKTWQKIIVNRTHRWIGFGAMKQLCQQMPSRGRFFIECKAPFIADVDGTHRGLMYVYVEHPEDAVLISLSWG